MWRTEPLDLFLYFTRTALGRVANTGVVRRAERDIHLDEYKVDELWSESNGRKNIPIIVKVFQ